MKLVYVSHPYTGDEEWNRQDAQEICTALKQERPDWCIINPLDVFAWADKAGLSYYEILEMCIDLMLACDAVYLCRGWDKSKGCRAEYERARLQRLELYYE